MSNSFVVSNFIINFAQTNRKAMKLLMREVIDIYSTSNEPIAILPEDQDTIYKVLKEHGFVEDRAKEIAYEGQWSSFNGCETFYIEEIEDWS